MLKKTIALGFASLLLASPAWAAPDWSAVDRAIGRAGAEQPGGVHRYSFPRSDLSVTLDGVTIKPSLALGSWAAFQPMGDEAMVMGDLVLTHDEVNPVLSRLLASGFTITALHNHLLRSSPATMYMHIAGHGDPVKLAAALRQALSASRTPLAAPQSPSASAAASRLDLDVAPLNRLMGGEGKTAGGILQYSFPRAERLMDGADGALDRDHMRQQVFADPAARQRLEAILHPMISAETLRQAEAAGERPIVFDVPLLTESAHWRERVHKVLVVDCREATQVARVMRRSGWAEETVQRVVAQQATRAARRAIADAVIFNEGLTLEQLDTQVQRLWQAWGADRVKQ